LSEPVARRPIQVLKRVVVLAIVGGVCFFFWRAIRDNWAQIQTHHFRLDYPLLVVSLGTVLAASLLSTYAWQLTLHGLSARRDMTFRLSVATVNSTSLTKYLPGKFWSYALQMYWLGRSGYSKALVLFVNLTNLVVSLLTGVLLALGFLLASGAFPWQWVGGAILLLVVAEVVCILYYGPAFRLGAALVKRVLRRDLGYFDVSRALMLRVHGVQLAAQVISGAGGYLLCFAIGYHLDLSTILLVMASLILADTAGFVFFLVPGGLGVREATMYFLLQGQSSASLALVFPLVTRLIYMAADVLLGAIALWLLRSSVRASAADVRSRPVLPSAPDGP
jgi:glycosyltransferase 2 family protein